MGREGSRPTLELLRSGGCLGLDDGFDWGLLDRGLLGRGWLDSGWLGNDRGRLGNGWLGNGWLDWSWLDWSGLGGWFHRRARWEFLGRAALTSGSGGAKWFG